MLLELTNTGLQHELDASLNGISMPKIKSLVIDGNNAALNGIEAIRALTDVESEIHRVPLLFVEKISAGTAKLYGHINDSWAGTIKGIGVLLEDDSLYGYAPYRPESGGFEKPAEYALTFDILHSKEQSAVLEINYDPLDSEAIAQRISERISAIAENDLSIINLTNNQIDIMRRQMRFIATNEAIDPSVFEPSDQDIIQSLEALTTSFNDANNLINL